MKKQMNIFQIKEDTTPEAGLNEMEISDLCDRKFKIIGLKILSQ